MFLYFDAHTHLQNMTDLSAILKRAQAAGVTDFMCLATHEGDWQKVLDIAKTHPNVRAGIGVHPWFLATLEKGWETRMETLLKAHPSLLVGEIGLDKIKADADPTVSSLDHQERVMRVQMDLAARYNRPFHMHCVRAWDRILHILKRNKRPDFFVSHSHHGNATWVPQLIDMGAYLSYSAIFVPSNRQKVQACLKATPLDRLLVESDCPDLAPEPSAIPELVKKMAVVREQDEAVLAHALYENAQRISHGR